MELNICHCGDSRNMDKIESNSIALALASPPYFTNKSYESYLKDFDEYIQMLKDVLKEVVRVVLPGGKIIINIGDICAGSRFNDDNHVEEVLIMPYIVNYLKSLDTYLFARYIWEKSDDPWANSPFVSFHKNVQHCEWRSLPSWEYVFCFRKGKKSRDDKSPTDGRFITKEFWKKSVHGIWKFRSVQTNKIHPAQFPSELPFMCIKLYSFPDDIVLDFFAGVGTSLEVGRKLNRNVIGYELDSRYCKIANNRLNAITDDMIEVQKPYRDKTVNKELQKDLFKKEV